MLNEGQVSPSFCVRPVEGGSRQPFHHRDRSLEQDPAPVRSKGPFSWSLEENLREENYQFVRTGKSSGRERGRFDPSPKEQEPDKSVDPRSGENGSLSEKSFFKSRSGNRKVPSSAEVRGRNEFP